MGENHFQLYSSQQASFTELHGDFKDFKTLLAGEKMKL